MFQKCSFSADSSVVHAIRAVVLGSFHVGLAVVFFCRSLLGDVFLLGFVALGAFDCLFGALVHSLQALVFLATTFAILAYNLAHVACEVISDLLLLVSHL